MIYVKVMYFTALYTLPYHVLFYVQVKDNGDGTYTIFCCPYQIGDHHVGFQQQLFAINFYHYFELSCNVY